MQGSAHASIRIRKGNYPTYIVLRLSGTPKAEDHMPDVQDAYATDFPFEAVQHDAARMF